jgi:hypothetical protein
MVLPHSAEHASHCYVLQVNMRLFASQDSLLFLTDKSDRVSLFGQRHARVPLLQGPPRDMSDRVISNPATPRALIPTRNHLSAATLALVFEPDPWSLTGHGFRVLQIVLDDMLDL